MSFMVRTPWQIEETTIVTWGLRERYPVEPEQKICGPLTPILTIGDGYPVVNETDLCLRYTATKMKR